ncbi:aldo/keto reductase [Halosegnis sp.]|uniref:aldo/keto reductase n=1 Tax=Halosegnis sp. TaxID=2864959 RepID=UPI0035D430E8
MTQGHVTVRGTEVPALGLGTWRLTGDDCYEAVSTALELGYQHIDTAQAYGNERRVGDAIRDSDVAREDIFLTTKLNVGNRSHETVIRTTEESLARLDTSYIDLLLIHNPAQRTPLGETLDAMNELVDRGKVRHIGVSNFGIDRLDRARSLSEAPIFTDQVQYNPYWPQGELLDYCAIHDVLLTAYSPLAHGAALEDDLLAEIGGRYNKSAAQVALRWLVQQGVATVPKATTREHLAANLAVFDFELTDEEMDAVRRPSKTRALGGFIRGRLPV